MNPLCPLHVEDAICRCDAWKRRDGQKDGDDISGNCTDAATRCAHLQQCALYIETFDVKGHQLPIGEHPGARSGAVEEFAVAQAQVRIEALPTSEGLRRFRGHARRHQGDGST